MPLTRRLPKFGFTSPNREEVQIVNIETLEKLLSGKRLANPVTPEGLFKAGAVSKKNEKVKILGTGELKNKIEISAHAFSKSAVAKIEAAGGKVTVLP
jgi:large subunit ribosomal protein L15